MALKTVSNLKDSVAALLSGIDLGNIDDLNGAIERAARVFTQRANIPEASSTQNIMVYDGVVEYPSSSDMFGDSIRDIKPMSKRRLRNDFVYKKTNDDFDREKDTFTEGTMATVTYVAGNPIARIVTSHASPLITLDSMNATTGWVASGGASGLIADTTYYYNEPAALRVSLSNGGTPGTIVKTLTQSVDLSAYIGPGQVFLAFECDDPTLITDIHFKIGSDSSNYYNLTVSGSFTGSKPAGEYYLVNMALLSTYAVGSPDATKIKYLSIGVDYGATGQSNVRFGGLWASLPTPMQSVYTTAAIFKNPTTSAILGTITTDNDLIVLSDPAYSILQFESAISVIQQTGGNLSSPVVQTWNQTLHGVRARSGAVVQPGLYDLYNGDNPSSELRTVGSWYD